MIFITPGLNVYALSLKLHCWCTCHFSCAKTYAA